MIKLSEIIKVPIEIGDTVLGGKFKNKRIVVKSIGKNDKGDITINNTEVGLAAYQKKNEYIGSNILAKNIIINNSKLDFLVDDFSKITLDNKIIINKNPDAKKIINTLNE